MSTTLVLCATALILVSIVCATAIRAWNGWLALRREELAQREDSVVTGHMSVRIELAHVRERLKKLEAIASDVDL